MRSVELYGTASKAAFDRANALVKEGKFAEARAVELLPSDRKLIEERIASSANRNDTKEKP